MLALNFGDWVFWEAYSPPEFLGQQKVTFDGPNKLILVNDNETELDFREDVYSAWKEWVQDPNHNNARWIEAISSVGGDPLPGARVLGTTFFLENGWRMRTWEGNHSLTVTGNVFTREGDPLFVNTIDPWTITINLNTSTLVEALTPDSGDTTITDGDIAAIAANVWSELVGGVAASERLEKVANNVWEYTVDDTRNESAEDRLKRIRTKTQDLAFSD